MQLVTPQANEFYLFIPLFIFEAWGLNLGPRTRW